MAVIVLSRALEEVFEHSTGRDIVIVCVGTDRSTGDAFGPIVGSKLIGLRDIRVYGCLEEPVHAVNLSATLETIRSSNLKDPFILAVDACLGKFDHVGQIIVEEGPLRPGAGVKKSLPEFGDFTITGVVNVSGFMEYFVLQNTRLNVVMKMSDIVVEALKTSLRRFQTRQRLVGANDTT
ncbi:spore protease YyaC [Alicyclobacillus mengziensis]|uniref:Spore protease YyaC n=2 Tax=Alicyclobacillus mengziensis TaxID=2931921 RepID=A0A9X7W2U8_9BACL|nr:spore protease YyaC [Alicyclobacillus mengziensis]